MLKGSSEQIGRVIRLEVINSQGVIEEELRSNEEHPFDSKKKKNNDKY